MREIKFRGRKENGGWEYGFYSHEWHINELDDIQEFHWIYVPCPGTTTECYDVNPETGGQYTGLKDKNGVEIYEGDIAKHIPTAFDSGACQGDVFWFGGHCRYALRGATSHRMDSCNTYEVIGNIHDNPELLEPGKGE